jgi:hypothetical protein
MSILLLILTPAIGIVIMLAIASLALPERRREYR